MPTQLNQVPEALQSDFDIVGDSGFFADPQQLFLDSLVKDPRDIVYTPHNGGHWLITSHELAREVLSNAELFGSFPIGIPANMEQRPRLIPLESDANEHRRYRRLLLPIFEPAAVARLQTGAQALAAEVLDEVLPTGEFDFCGRPRSRYQWACLFVSWDWSLSVSMNFMPGKRAFIVRPRWKNVSPAGRRSAVISLRW